MLALLFGCVACGATMIGGLFALRLRDKLHLILGFSAGAVVAVAFFDLIPEALELAGTSYTPSTVLTYVAAGFLAYLLLDRSVMLHSHTEEEHVHDTTRGTMRAGSLAIHSFLDGLGVGLAFQASPAIGSVVAAAVLAHDFSDGINTVNMIVRHGGDLRSALRWLFVDALAPLAGIVATFFFVLPEDHLGLLLAVFAGFFLYIGASDLIPESHHQHPKLLTTVTTVIGMVVLYVIIHIAG